MNVDQLLKRIYAEGMDVQPPKPTRRSLASQRLDRAERELAAAKYEWLKAFSEPDSEEP